MRHLGVDAAGAVRGRNALGVLGAGLLHHFEPVAHFHGQEREGRRHRLGKEARALTAAEYEQRDAGVGLRLPVRTARRLDDGGAHRVAGEACLGGKLGRQVLGRRERRGDAGDALGEHLVGAAEHGVLLVDDRLLAEIRGGKHGRDGGIAAKADNGERIDLGEDLSRLEIPEAELGEREAAPDQVPSADPGGVDAIGLGRRQRAAERGGPPVRDEREAEAPFRQNLRQGLGGDHMSAGTACGEHDGAPVAGHVCSPGRRLVSASIIPMPNAMASTDEPP